MLELGYKLKSHLIPYYLLHLQLMLRQEFFVAQASKLHDEDYRKYFAHCMDGSTDDNIQKFFIMISAVLPVPSCN